MKVAFDENIPSQMYEAFKSLVDSPIFQHDLRSAADYRPVDERGDEGWLTRFADDGGEVVVSGDGMMRQNLHELLALSKAGMITYFFASKWNNCSFFKKSAMLLNWWPVIESHLATAAKGDCWEIPLSWSGEFRNVTPPSEIIIARSKPGKPKLVSSN